MDLLFSISNLLVMPFWLLMIFLPGWNVTRRVMQSPWPVVLPALLYAGLVLPRLGSLAGLLASPQLNQLAAALGTPEGTVIVWAHLLAFDLFAGRWIYLDSREKQLSAWLTSPALFLTLMAGPIGFLVYLGARKLWFKPV